MNWTDGHANRSCRGGHSPGKPGKVREFKSSQGKCVLACMKFGQLLLWKIIKIVAVRCQIFRLKCTKSDLGWGFPRPSWI